MNRRQSLQGLAALSFMAMFPGCHRNGDKDDERRHDDEKHDRPGASKIRTLQIHLQGSFAVVQQKDRNYRIKAYVPYDEGRKHEFLFSNLLTPKDKHKSYQFKLDEDSLELSGRPPYIDHGFDGFNVQIPEWHTPADSFVLLDLPPATVMTYTSPAIPVLFEPSAEFPQGQFTTLPRNHILEYRVKDGCKVHLRSNQLGDCTPITCDDLYQQQVQLRKGWKSQEMHGPLHPYPSQELIRCSQSDVCIYFLGVGLTPRPQEEIWPEDMDHAVKFFNEKLLPSLYGRNIPPGRRIARLNASPCSPSTETAMSSGLMPAVQRFGFSQAGLRNVVATENCTAPVVTATSTKTIGQ